MGDIEKLERDCEIRAKKNYEDGKSNIVPFIISPQERLNMGLITYVVGTLVTGYYIKSVSTPPNEREYFPLDEYDVKYFFPDDQRLDSLVLFSYGAIWPGRKICRWELFDEMDSNGWGCNWFDVTYDYNAEGYTYDD